MSTSSRTIKTDLDPEQMVELAEAIRREFPELDVRLEGLDDVTED